MRVKQIAMDCDKCSYSVMKYDTTYIYASTYMDTHIHTYVRT